MTNNKRVESTIGNTKKLLIFNSRVLQGLHYVKGYDFTKPFDVVSGNGSFTLNKIKKECATLGIELENVVATLLIKHGKNAFFHKELHIVDIPNFTKFQIYKSNGDVKSWKFNFDLYYSVGDFEAHRKNMAETWFVVIQNKDYLVANHKDIYGDYKDRFVINSFGYGYKTAIQNGKEVNVKNVAGYNGPEFFVVNGTEPKTTDKSGYCMEYYKGELQRRLRAYKANKRKNEADNYTTTSDIINETTEIKAKTNTLKHTLSEMILNDKHKIVERVMFKYTRVCDWIKQLEEKLANKKYSSVSDIRYDINCINKYYNEIMDVVNADQTEKQEVTQ